jgi:hypothetical protein
MTAPAAQKKRIMPVPIVAPTVWPALAASPADDGPPLIMVQYLNSQAAISPLNPRKTRRNTQPKKPARRLLIVHAICPHSGKAFVKPATSRARM